MIRTSIAAIGLASLLTMPAAGQDVKTVLGNASKAMGVETLTSIHYYGVAQTGNLGQNNNANQPWPLASASDYVRAIDFSQPASRATWVTYASPVQGGAAAQGQGQQNITPQNQAWAQQLEIWVTPWGFLKGAAANTATVRAQTIDGPPLPGRLLELANQISGRPAVQAGRITSTARTWSSACRRGSRTPSSATCSSRPSIRLSRQQRLEVSGQNRTDVEEGGRCSRPTSWARGQSGGSAEAASRFPPARGAVARLRAGTTGAAAAGTGIREARGRCVPDQRRVQRARDGVRGTRVIFEPGPQNEARAQAIIAETKRVIPNKPIATA